MVLFRIHHFFFHLIKVLKWVGGYYNGDIKTRKTVLVVELNADKMVLQRSEQFRELLRV